MGAELLHADWQKNMTKLRVSFTNSPKIDGCAHVRSFDHVMLKPWQCVGTWVWIQQNSCVDVCVQSSAVWGLGAPSVYANKAESNCYFQVRTINWKLNIQFF